MARKSIMICIRVKVEATKKEQPGRAAPVFAQVERAETKKSKILSHSILISSTSSHY